MLSQTYGKGEDQFSFNAPRVIERGKGSRIWSEDGRTFIDVTMSLGAVILGHAYEPVDNYVIDAIRGGVNFPRASRFEEILVEKVNQIVPSMGSVRFGKTSSEATNAAVRTARAFTGCSYVVFPCNGAYLGNNDWYLAVKESNWGIPNEIRNLSKTYKDGDLEDLRRVLESNLGQVACVILEPYRCDVQSDEYFRRLRKLCDQYSVLLIFDETISGFRFEHPCVHVSRGVIPDMCILGKAISNGYSLSMLLGKSEIMDISDVSNEGVIKCIGMSSTYGGEVVGLAAGYRTLGVLEENGVHEHLLKIGTLYYDEASVILVELGLELFIEFVGPTTYLVHRFRSKEMSYCNEHRTFFFERMVEYGVFFKGVFIPCYSHSEEDVEEVLIGFRKACEDYVRYLEAPHSLRAIAKDIFRKYQ